MDVGALLERPQGVGQGGEVQACGETHEAPGDMGDVPGVGGAGVTGDHSTTTFGYANGTGALATVTTPGTAGDIVTTNVYDGVTGHLTEVKTMQGSTIIEQDDYAYPTPGTLTLHADQVSYKQVTRLLANATGSTSDAYFQVYTYDDLNQLTHVATYAGTYNANYTTSSPTSSENFTYDSLGNRTGGGFTTNSMNQYLTDAAGHALTYDARPLRAWTGA